MRYLARKSVESRSFNEKIAGQLAAKYVPLEPLLPAIQQATFVLWGDHDRVIDVSSATVFAGALPDVELEIMKDVGHLPMIERPAESAAYYAEFLSKQ